jgi:hypothetical protein
LLPPVFRDAFIDESSQTQHRYLILGGIIAPSPLVAQLDAVFRSKQAPDLNAKSEMKWNKCSNTKLDAYKRVVSLLFATQFRDVHYHALVVDTTQQRHAAFNKGSREIGFSKEIFQLALKFSRVYPAAYFHIYLDDRETDQSPESVRDMLNFKLQRKGDKRDWAYRRMQFRQSHSTPMIQLADIITGGLAFRINGHYDKIGASPSKKALCDHLLWCARLGTVTKDTTNSGKYTIWHRQLRGVP